MRKIEHWRWRYRDTETGRTCRTLFACSADEAARLYPGAEPIEGTMVLREVDDDALDTTPGVFRRSAQGS